MTYSDDQINNFLELAQEVGITKAKRELGYPKDWSTAKRWADMRGIKVAVDELRSRAAQTREWYKDQEVMTVAQEGFNRVYDELVNNPDLTADDQKKLASALKGHYDVWANVQGRATNISENRETDTMDAHLMELINIERAKNLEKKTEPSQGGMS